MSRMRWVFVMLCAGCAFRVPAGTESTGDGGGDTGGGDANVDADLRPVGRCGTPGAITETFQTAPDRWIANGNATVSGGVLHVAAGASLESRSFVDLIGAAAEVEVLEVGDPGASFRLQFDGARYLGIEARAGQIVATATNGVFTGIPLGPADRYWRISESAGTVSFSTSADRSSWRSLGTVATPTYASAMRILLGSIGGSTGSTPARLDNVDTGVASASWCKSTTLVDTFGPVNVLPYGPLWNTTGRVGTSCTPMIFGGAAHLDQTGQSATDCWFGSSAAYDLRDSSVSTYITAIGTFLPGWRTYLAVRDDANRRLSIAFDQNQLCATGTGVIRTCVPYATSDEYWRLREAGGTVFFEKSTNDATWSSVHELPTPFDPRAVTVLVGTVAETALASGIGLSVSDINP